MKRLVEDLRSLHKVIGEENIVGHRIQAESNKIVFRLRPLTPEQIHALKMKVTGAAIQELEGGSVNVEFPVSRTHLQEILEQALQTALKYKRPTGKP